MLPQKPLEAASSQSSINDPPLPLTHQTGATGSGSTSQLAKQGLPYPNNMKVEKRSETSLMVTWDPPTAPLPINQSIDVDNLSDLNEQLVTVQTYNLFLNNELRGVISGLDERVAVLDDVDLTVPNRISIQAVIAKGIMSKPQECTLLFGSSNYFYLILITTFLKNFLIKVRFFLKNLRSIICAIEFICFKSNTNISDCILVA